MPPPVCLLDVGADKFVHVTTVLRDVLHWLPMPQRIQFKVAQLLLNFDCVRGSGPAYFRDVRIPVAGISSRSNFRSVQRGDMVVQRTRTRAARSSELSRCGTSRLACHSCEFCLPPFNIHQSRTIQSWVENPSLQPSLRHPREHFCFKSVLYLLGLYRIFYSYSIRSE